MASTDDLDRRSSFSNYGPDNVRVSAPGEGLVTTYPGGTYAAVWGTSFSAPLVSGATSLVFHAGVESESSWSSCALPGVKPRFVFPLVAEALSNARKLPAADDSLGYGGLDLSKAVKAIRKRLDSEYSSSHLRLPLSQ